MAVCIDYSYSGGKLPRYSTYELINLTKEVVNKFKSLIDCALFYNINIKVLKDILK